MYPTLTYLLRDLFGLNILLPFPTYGFIVAIAFVIGTLIWTKELKRKENLGLLLPTTRKVLKGAPVKQGEYIWSAVTGFIIGFKLIYGLLNYRSCSNDPQAAVFSLEGNFIAGVLFAAISVGYLYWDNKKKRLPKPEWVEEIVHPYQQTGNMIVFIAIFAIIGAKLFHILENLGDFANDPFGMIFSGSGLTFYGGMIVASIAAIIVGNKKGMKVIPMIDAAAPAMMIAYGVGRMACHLSGDGCWGIPNPGPKPSFMSFLPDWMWSYNYPHNVINEGVLMNACDGKYCHVLSIGVFPTSIYESLFSIIVGLILLLVARKINIVGLLFSIYLMINGLERYIVEHIRVNNIYKGVGLTQAEIISQILFAIGVAGAIFFIYKHRKSRPNLG